MLYLVGLGLSDETDITVKGLEVVKKASRVYLEAYTSILLVDQARLVSHSHSGCFAPKLNADIVATGSLLWPVNSNRRPRNGRVEQ
jgi:hypothetical protein